METPIFTPKIPEFHPKYGIFATFLPFSAHFPHGMTRYCTFATFLINASRRFDKLDDLRTPEPVEAPESKRVNFN